MHLYHQMREGIAEGALPLPELAECESAAYRMAVVPADALVVDPAADDIHYQN